MVRVLKNTRENISYLAGELKKGSLVAFPTDTVYGLGVNAFDKAAVYNLYELKNRPLNKPLIVLCHSIEQIEDHFIVNDTFYTLANKFFPGALTLILNKKESSKIHNLGSSTPQQGVRIPNNASCLELIKQSGVPLLSSSANRSSNITSTKVCHVVANFKDTNLEVLESDKALIGLESTVLNITDENNICLLRHGAIGIEEIEKLGIEVKTDLVKNSIESYTPKTPIELNSHTVGSREGLLAFGRVSFFISKGAVVVNLSEKANLEEASTNLFDMLLKLDSMNLRKINIMPIPKFGLGITINERLLKLCDRTN